MAESLKSYRKIVGTQAIEEIEEKAERFSDKHIVCVNSTYQGGGVAEMLNSLVVLFNEAGIKFGWRVLHGTPDFFTVTKKFHNALQGEAINLSERKKQVYCDTNKRFSLFSHIDHDLVIVHDPQPLPLIRFYKKKQPWIFRCHIDLTSPNQEVWHYLKRFIVEYDHMVVSRHEYMKRLPMPQSVIHPSIDPLSAKNEFLKRDRVKKYLGKFGVELDKPIVSQVSRFDKWKDPEGVIRVFERVRRKKDCQLVMLGSFAADDPEGAVMLDRVNKKVASSRYKNDIKILVVENHILANCLQRASHVVIQKSLKEGFGLTVSEAMYKGTPVVASAVGGIPAQVINGTTGYLHKPLDEEGFASSVVKLLENQRLREQMGLAGSEYVKENFLITRMMLDWLNIFGRYLK